MSGLRSYLLVTGAYWGFTLTDGALRMLVLLHFHRLGYSPATLSILFLLYEFCGVLTNLGGGWIAARFGLRSTLFGGLALQVGALSFLALLPDSLSAPAAVAWIMASQAFSGIAKDLTKMSAKSAIKVLLPKGAEGRLFTWVAILTGSKNALKGAGFFLGGLLLTTLGFAPGLYAMAGALLILLVLLSFSLPPEADTAKKKKVKFTQLFSSDPAINRLSAARLFLFGSRDVWFVVGLPLYLATQLGWNHTAVGSFLALWIIGYGVVQSSAPALLRKSLGGHPPDGATATTGAFALAALTLLILILVAAGVSPWIAVVGGLMLFGILFALNSSVHSFLILAYAGEERVTLDVGFYYMANAGGRLLGTLLSGILFASGGLVACLGVSALMVATAGLLSRSLPKNTPHP